MEDDWKDCLIHLNRLDWFDHTDGIDWMGDKVVEEARDIVGVVPLQNDSGPIPSVTKACHKITNQRQRSTRKGDTGN